MFVTFTEIKYITIRAWNYTIVLFNIVNEVVQIGTNMKMIDKLNHNILN